MPAPLAEVYIREKKQGGNSHGKIFKKEGTPFGYTVFGLVICGDGSTVSSLWPWRHPTIGPHLAYLSRLPSWLLHHLPNLVLVSMHCCLDISLAISASAFLLTSSPSPWNQKFWTVISGTSRGRAGRETFFSCQKLLYVIIFLKNSEHVLVFLVEGNKTIQVKCLYLFFRVISVVTFLIEP